MNYSKYDTYEYEDDPEIPDLDWQEEMLRCHIEKTRKKAVCVVLQKLAALTLKLSQLNHPDFVDNEVRKLK